jgi:hypothetical protein
LTAALTAVTKTATTASFPPFQNSSAAGGFGLEKAAVDVGALQDLLAVVGHVDREPVLLLKNADGVSAVNGVFTRNAIFFRRTTFFCRPTRIWWGGNGLKALVRQSNTPKHNSPMPSL